MFMGQAEKEIESELPDLGDAICWLQAKATER